MSGMTDTAVIASTLVRTVLGAAIRAPSPHNTQPWVFRVGTDTTIDVFLDEDRVLTVCDPEAREATLACGAALLNIRMTLAAVGREARVELMPDRATPRHLATVWIGEHHRSTPDEIRLANAIARRRTNRRPFCDREVPVAARHALTQAASAEGGRLVLLDDPRRFDTFVTLLRRADHLQNSDTAFQAELRAWTHGGHRSDGVPVAAGGPRPADGTVLALRDFVRDSGEPREREYERCPLVAVLTTPGDTRLDALRGGQAMQRVLLAATAAGLDASFLAAPVEVPATRTELRALLGGHEYPQTVLRLGYGYPGPVTRRRPVEDVTTRERWP